MSAQTVEELEKELAAVRRVLDTMGKIVHNQTTANQAAWIEWQHGRGAEAAMAWIHNGLWGPGLIPDEDEPYAKEAQAWYDAHRADPMPQCACGRPSNQLWMGGGACSSECMKVAREKYEAGGAA